MHAREIAEIAHRYPGQIRELAEYCLQILESRDATISLIMSMGEKMAIMSETITRMTEEQNK